MATYAVQTPVHAGTAPAWVTPVSGDLAPTGPSNYLVVFNGSVASITVTLPVAPTYDGLAVASRTYVVLASTLAAPVLGYIPLPPSVYGTGTTVVNYSAVTTVSVHVLSTSVS
jgi:hypothetical protein